jgi:2-oxoglutarate ferredoxin oxidoreductase subunit alpha
LSKYNFSIIVASVNGSGTQTANNTLSRTFFREGAYVSAKNLFPSNISGLPTWFAIRTHESGYLSRENLADVIVLRNKDTVQEDLKKIKPNGIIITDSDWPALDHKNSIAIPYKELAQDLSDSIRLRKLLSNMIYVGFLSECLKVDFSVLTETLGDLLPKNQKILDSNLKAIEKGREFAKSSGWVDQFPFQLKKNIRPKHLNQFIDGNSAAAIGAVMGGCTVLSWYPITPASSLAETFIEACKELRPQKPDGETEAIVQAEDELSAISMVIGASWAGARAMTSTSGPGLSLMAEAAGLSYFAEIPTVVWDVQRAGPSTGLPTRTMQGDLEFAYRLSHGDTEHIVLIPSTPEECYLFAQLAFDLAEKFQTLVIVLSDLDMGMNFRMSAEFKLPTQPMNRGKILNAEQLNDWTDFARYRDVDGDGICYRTLPGTKHINAAFFTRGTGHTETSAYSEDNANFEKLLNRLKMKIKKSADALPAPIEHKTAGAEILLVSYGTTSDVVPEIMENLSLAKVSTSHIVIRALPMNDSLAHTFQLYKKIIVLEQNRDAQLRRILSGQFPEFASRFLSVLSYDGLPACAENFSKNILSILNSNSKSEVTL